MLRWLTAGESHGPALTAILEGLPAGVPLTTELVDWELRRRRLGVGRGARQNFEADRVSIQGGVRHGETIGGPIAIVVANTEWPKWNVVMSADPVSEEALAGLARAEALTRPRPGHADLAGMQKFSFDDARPILERASARETAARVALGTAARSFLQHAADIAILSHVVAIGSVGLGEYEIPSPEMRARIDDDPVRCADPQVSQAMQSEIAQAHKEGDTLGGVVEVLVYGLPPGLGSFAQWDRRLDARLAGALMSIQAIKGVEVGDGFASARARGSAAHDEVELDPTGRMRRRTARSGGTEGGMSTGELLRIRAAMKPISTVPRALDTVDTVTRQPAKANSQRSDVCAVPAAGIVAEAMVALVLADAFLEKFGGDHLDETQRNYRAYIAALKIR